MKKYSMAGGMSVFALVFLTTGANAQEELSYSFAELNYVAISNGSRFDANVQYEVQPQVYIFGGYSYSKVDVTVLGVDFETQVNVGSLGAGYHATVLEGIDLHGGSVSLYGEVGYMLGTASVEVIGGTVDEDVDGFVGAIGARAFVLPKVEGEIALTAGPDDFGGINIIGRYYFRDQVSVGGGIIDGDLGIGLRANF